MIRELSQGDSIWRTTPDLRWRWIGAFRYAQGGWGTLLPLLVHRQTHHKTQIVHFHFICCFWWNSVEGLAKEYPVIRMLLFLIENLSGGYRGSARGGYSLRSPPPPGKVAVLLNFVF